MAERKDVLLIYNEQDTVVAEIVDELDNIGYTSFFWRRDVPINSDVDGAEIAHMDLTDNVMVLLGSEGWGPSHKRLTQEALNRKKNIIPVLTGTASDEALAEFDNYFKNKRYVDLTVRTPQGYQKLIDTLGPPQNFKTAARFDRIIATLRDGNQAERGNVIAQIRTSKTLNRPGLAVQLRKYIAEFDARIANNFPEAPRGSGQIESARSWLLSALIWTEPEGEANKKVILEHLQVDVEPSETIRYWILGGIYYKEVSFIEEALRISREDESALIRLLARVIGNPDDEETIASLQNELRSDDSTNRWRALRVLRVVPVPEVATDVCAIIAQTETANITYDAFYALFHRSVAEQATPILANTLGISELIKKIITITTNSESNALENFTHILEYFDIKTIDEALSEEAQNNGSSEQVAKIRRFLSDFQNRTKANELYMAGFAADTNDVTKDWLDIRQDVKTLSAIMVARDVPLPLAIGLFGDWGTGKSFFMGSLKEEIKSIQAKARLVNNGLFCKNTVQIDFNAWHYVDTSLWASLVTKIFDELDNYVSPPLTLEKKEQAIKDKLFTNEKKEQEVTEKKIQAQNILAEKEALLAQLQTVRVNRQVSLWELNEDDFNKIIEPQQREEIQKSLNAIGYNDILKTGDDFNKVITEAASVKSRITSLFVGILSSANRNLILILLAAVLLIFPLIGWAVHHYLKWDNILLTVNAFIAELTTVIGGAILIMKKGLAKTKAALQIVLDAKNRIDQQLDAKRNDPTSAEDDLTAEILALKTTLISSDTELTTAQDQIIALKDQMAALHEEYSLNRFLSDIKKTEVYNSHLGIISQIRKHFDSLVERLKSIPESGDGKFNPVDRIVLYIDDLDRCPVEKVFEVLQAVHLMLAYPLFVVVVGVDPRWLLSSLQNNYAVLHQESDNADDGGNWRPTPQNFLEKIFQIPFCLRPMSSIGFGTMMSNLLSVKVKDEGNSDSTTGSQNTAESQAETSPAGNAPTRPSFNEKREQRDSAIPGMQQIASPAMSKSPISAEGFTINEESLMIKSWEAAFASELYQLIPTPRSAKRFTNIYRILKASVQKNELMEYEGTAELPGEYALTMTLLAILIGQPQYAVSIFQVIYGQAKKGKGLNEAFNELIMDKIIPVDLINKLASLTSTTGFPNNAISILKWLPLISRFSFELGKLFIKEELDQK